MEEDDENVWLVKCPARVANTWRELSASSSSDSNSIAKYCVSVDLLRPDCSTELTMEMIGSELRNIPKLYSISKTKDFCAMSIFSETNQGEVAVEGTVTHKLDMIPNCGVEAYGKLYRERNTKHLAQDRQPQTLPVHDLKEHSTPKPAVVKKALKKRTRSDHDEVEAKIFKLFGRQSKWTLKQLIQETNQPVLFLKEVLRELCVFNTRGFFFELKPEYKKIGEEDATGA